MSAVAGAPVVVGIDGSPRSLDAVIAAADQAARRGRPLRIVHAFIWPLIRRGRRPGVPAPPLEVFEAQARGCLDQAVRAADQAAPDVPVTADLITGGAAAVLIGESRTAHLIVVGDRGLGAFTGLIVGSVAVQVTTHAHCPVLVVRGEQRTTGPVVVGVDGSPTSARAVEFAAEEAEWRGAELVAVHAYRAPAVLGPGDMMPLVHDPALLADEEDRVLAVSLAGLAQRHPDLTVRREVAYGSPGRLLTEWSGTAQLVVVGDRGHGGFAGLLLGSVSQHLMYHAKCPVAVVRRHEDPP